MAAHAEPNTLRDLLGLVRASAMLVQDHRRRLTRQCRARLITREFWVGSYYVEMAFNHLMVVHKCAECGAQVTVYPAGEPSSEECLRQLSWMLQAEADYLAQLYNSQSPNLGPG